MSVDFEACQKQRLDFQGILTRKRLQLMELDHQPNVLLLTLLYIDRVQHR